MSNYIDIVNKTKVTAKLMSEIIQSISSTPRDEQLSYESRALRMIDYLNKKGFGEKKIAALCTAIDFRLQALANFRRDPAYRGWAMPSTENGADSIDYDLLRIAAILPLQNDGPNKVRFNSDNFRARLLSISTSKGQA